jgi:hypothetical protein
MSFVPYPDISDPDFQDRIFWKKEFLKTMYRTDFQFSKTEDLCRRGEFRMQNHQEFIRNFISPETPYNGTLLFHGTGVGKTCAAIGTTEGLRDYVYKGGKKIYVLSSENIRPNFYKELYDADRENIEHNIHAIPGSYQCAGDRYYIESMKAETKARAIKDMIREYYVFKGFGQFANFVDIELGADKGEFLPEHMTKPKMTMEDGSYIDIGDYFSNSVIVIDEAHGIAGENKASVGDEEDSDADVSDDDEEDRPKKPKPKSKPKSKAKGKSKSDKGKSGDSKTPRSITKRSLFRVLVESIIPACRAKGSSLKILLLTATPMKDNVRELGNLLQILNENDGRRMEEGWQDRIFPRGMMKYTDLEDAFTDEQRAELVRYSRGYISFVKGDNPVTFPLALLPPADQLYEPGKRFDPAVINPIFSYREDEGNIQDKYDIKNPLHFRFNLVKCEMDWYQYLCYQALIRGDIPNATLASDTYPRMIANMAFPIVVDNPSNPITPFNIIENPALLRGEKEGGILGGKDAGDRITRAVHGNMGFEYTFRSKQKIVPGTADHVSPKKYVSYDIHDPIWVRCGFFMMIDERDKDGVGISNPGSGFDEHSQDYALSMFSRKLDLFVRNINESPGIAYVYSEFVQSGAILAGLALEENGYVRYHPSLKEYINKETGLPKVTLRQEVPECFLHDLNERQIERLPENHYRCSVCGQLYNRCRANNGKAGTGIDAHNFNLSTYVVVTGSQGGVKEIAEAVSDNMRGQKIKVVIGTKVTGTGVDFKWVRQVHILDPWHNNTRIFQAIGRGLRHCSHADLPEADRNVRIFKYASTTDVSPIVNNDINIYDDEQLDAPVLLYGDSDSETVLTSTYRDLLTETVDEHMYRRVVRKDLIIKVIERTLKQNAIDCEFNRNRNMFPGAIDFSRECDYMKCAYTCEGFQHPIRYVRRIRVYESGLFSYIDGYDFEHDMGNGESMAISDIIGDGDQSNADLWEQLHHTSMMLQGRTDIGGEYTELLVDIPIPGPGLLDRIDNSTYNLHFSAPQIDKAVKLISRLFQKTQALKLDKIVYLIKKLNPQLEDTFIYSALDKIVGNPPFIKPMSIIDKYGRKGKLIVHNKIYIYHPLELEDTRIPMSYRSKPLSIKSRYYNMEKLTAKKVKTMNMKAEHIDPAEVQRLLEFIESLNFDSITDIIMLHNRLYGALIGEIADLLEQMVLDNAKNPTQSNVQYLVEYCLQSGMAFFSPETLDRTINDLLLDCNAGRRNLLHIMKSTTQAGTNVMIFNKVWVKRSIDNLPGGMTFLPSINTGDKFDLRYPHSDLSVHLDEPRKVLGRVNDSNTEYIGKMGIYGMMSRPIFRTIQPVIKQENIRSILLNAVKDYNEEYPNHTTLNKCKFKVFDQNQREQTRTKAQEISKRGEIKGKVCLNATDGDIHKLLVYLCNVMQDPGNLFIVTAGNPEIDIFAFMSSLSITGKNNDGVFVPSNVVKSASCESLKRLLMVANYYSLNGLKWFLNPIDTAIYRPKK